MRIERIHIQNYGSFYGQHGFAFADRGLVMVLGDNQDEPRMNSNGAGKSSTFDALDWCLFGVVPKGDHADSVINEEAGRDCKVTVELREGDRVIRVLRYRKFTGEDPKSGVQLEVNGQAGITALDPKETQRLIELELGLDREVFHACVLFGQNDRFHFADATDSERMSILTKILQMEEIDDWLDLAKAKHAGAQLALRNHENTRLQLDGKLEWMNAQDFGQQSQAWDNERQAHLHEATRQLNEHMANLAKTEQVLVLEPRVLESHATLKAHHDLGMSYDWSHFDGGISRARQAEQAANAKFQETVVFGKQLRSRMDKIKATAEGDCSECGQPVTRDHLDREVRSLEPELAGLREQYVVDEAALGQARAEVQRHEQIKSEQQRLHHEGDQENQRKYLEAQQQLRDMEEARRYLVQVQGHVAALRQAMEERRVAVNPWAQKQQELEADKARVIQELQLAGQSISAADEELRYLDFWVKALGPKGLKSYILDTRLQEMTDAANEWVRVLTGGTFWVRFETQTLGRTTKKLSNKINIRAFRYNPDGSISERNYKSCSPGERKRLSWAIDFGLSRLVAARATKRYDLLILDEVFTYVDAAGGEAVIEMLRHLRREKSSIFVIEHSHEFQAQFEECVVVRKHMGRSQILEESDGQGEGQAQVQQGRQREEEATPPDGTEPQAKPKGKARGRRVPRRVPVSAEGQ